MWSLIRSRQISCLKEKQKTSRSLPPVRKGGYFRAEQFREPLGDTPAYKVKHPEGES